MIKVNKILLIFFGGIFVIIFGLFQFIETRTFTNYLLNPALKKLIQPLGLQLSVKRVDLQFFPPATYFETIEAEKKDSFKLRVDSAGAIFRLSNLLRNDFNLHTLKLHGGILSIKDSSRNTKEWSWDDIEELKKLHHVIHNFWDKSKLGQIDVSKIIIQSGNQRGMIHSASIATTNLDIRASLEAVDVNLGGHQLDGVRAEVTLSPEKLDIASLKIEKDFNYFAYSGSVQIPDGSINGHIDLSGPLSLLPEEFSQIKELKEIQGNLKTSFLFDLSRLKKGISNGTVELTEVKFRHRDFSRVAFGFALEDDRVIIKKFNIHDKYGQIDFDEEVKVFNIATQKVLPFEAELKVLNFNINSILPIIQPSLSPISANLNLGLVFGIDDKNGIYFNTKPGGKVKEFILRSSSGGKILAVPHFTLDSFILKISKDHVLQFNYDLQFDTGTIKGTGNIDQQSLSFDAKTANFELLEFGAVSGVEIKGRANLDIKIAGLIEKAAIGFNGVATDFEVVGLKLGLLNLNLKLDLDRPRLRINHAIGKYKTTQYDGSGLLDFTQKGGPDLKINLSDGKIEDVIEMCFTGIPLSTTLKNIFRGNIKGRVGIEGTFNSTGINVFGKVIIPRLYVYKEGFEKGEASFSYANKTLQVQKARLKKSKGNLELSFQYDSNTDYIEYDATMEGMMLDDFYYYRFLNSGLQGELSADLFGSGTVEDLTTRNIVKITHAKIKDKSLDDSILKIYNNGTDVFINASLGALFSLDSYVNLAGDIKKKSNYVFNMQADDIKNFLGILSVHNINDTELHGEVDIEGKGTFDIKNWTSMDAELNVKRLSLQKDKDSLRILDKGLIKISAGHVQAWDLHLQGGEHYMRSHGLGSLKSELKITQAFNLPFQFFEIFTPNISSLSGNIRGLSVAKLIDGKFLYSFDLDGTDIGIRSVFSPLGIDDGKFSMNISGNEILIEKFEGTLGKGSMNGNGRIKINFPYPEIELNIEFNKTLLPLFKQSSLVFSGNSFFQGRQPPYKLRANVYLVRGEIKDDLNFIRENLSSGGKTYKGSTTDRIGQLPLLDYNVNLNFLSPLLLRNQLMEFYLFGNSNVWGSELSLNLQSKVEIVPGQSKLFFKGHEFIISKGTIEFDKINGPKNPFINIRGGTRISGYNIIFDGSGFLDNLSVNFYSEPMLAQEDILSLLTIGVTSQVSKTLQSSDLQAVTSLSLGSILMDQFGITENLSKSVGVKLSVLPELGHDDINPMQGRASTAEPGASKIKSATKIKIQKRVKEFDLSFSSTFGGSLQQKQEMNINYNLRPDLSVQGVYEMYSTDSTNNRTSPDSAGVDLIWKKTFK